MAMNFKFIDGQNPDDSVDQIYHYPRHDIDPKKKDRKWRLRYCKAFYQDFLIHRKGKLFYNNRGQYHENLRYALGQQGIEQYKVQVGCDDTHMSFINTNWEIVPIMPKFIDITIGNMQKREYHIECNPIDPVAVEEEKQTRYMLRANVHLQKALQRIEKIIGEKLQGPKQDDMPKTFEEIELYMQLKYKHKMAIAMEKGLDLIFYLNDWKQISEQLDFDLVAYGAAGTRDYIDQNGLPRVRRVDPRRLLTAFSKTPHFEDCEAYGELITMTVAEFERRMDRKLSHAEKEQLYEQFSKDNPPADLHQWDQSTDGNYGGDYRFGSPYDDVVITVLDCEFASTNKSKYERKSNRYGNSATYRKSYGYKKPERSKYKREAMEDKYKVWYKAMWVVGTDFIFQDGLVTDQKITRSSFAEAQSNFYVIAPGMVDMNNISLVERMIPVADDIQLNIIKLRQAIARARAKGLLIEIGGLENIPKGKGGEVFQPLELVAMYDQTGNMLYRNLDDSGKPMGVPIQELENGMARDVMNYIQIINFYLGLLRDATGINEIADASTPDPDILKGVAEMAVQSTNNALKSLYDARKYLFEKVAYSLTLRLQEAVKKRKIKGYVRALGTTDYEFIQVNKDISLHEFGIKVEEKPDEQERLLFEQRLDVALEKEQITIDTYYFVKSIDNLKLAQQYLSLAIKKKRAEDQAMAERAARITAEEQRNSALAASQAKQQETVIETDEKIRLEEAKAELQDRLKHNEFLRQLQLKDKDGAIKTDLQNVADRNKVGMLEMTARDSKISNSN